MGWWTNTSRWVKRFTHVLNKAIQLSFYHPQQGERQGLCFFLVFVSKIPPEPPDGYAFFSRTVRFLVNICFCARINIYFLFLCSSPVWLHHHLCSCFPSGSSPRSAQQHHRDPSGRLQVCHSVEETHASASDRYRFLSFYWLCYFGIKITFLSWMQI